MHTLILIGMGIGILAIGVIAGPTIRTIFAEAVSDVVKDKNKLVAAALAAKTQAEQDLAAIKVKADADLAKLKADTDTAVADAKAEALKWKTTLEAVIGKPVAVPDPVPVTPATPVAQPPTTT